MDNHKLSSEDQALAATFECFSKPERKTVLCEKTYFIVKPLQEDNYTRVALRSGHLVYKL